MEKLKISLYFWRMDSKSMLFLLLCFMIGQNVFSQTTFLNSLGTPLVGPDNVSNALDGQSEYYASAYQALLERANNQMEQHRAAIAEFTEKKRLNKDDKKRKAHLSDQLSILESEIETIHAFLSMWSSYEEKRIEWMRVLKSIGGCLALTTTDSIYAPTAYSISQSEERNALFWNEYVDTQMFPARSEKKIVAPATSKWVMKKDPYCTPSIGNDCMIRCLEDTPAKYRVYKFKAQKRCPDGYAPNMYGSGCLKSVRLNANADGSQMTFKFFEGSSKKTLMPLKLEPIDCK